MDAGLRWTSNANAGTAEKQVIPGGMSQSRLGINVTEDMGGGLKAIANLEHLISESGYDCKNIVRLNVYTTSTQEFFMTCLDVYVPFLQKHGIQQATTLLEVKGLFAALTVELEATVVK